MSTLSLNSNIFFVIEDGQILAWDYKNHTQFLLSDEYLAELFKVSRSEISTKNKILDELLESGLITYQQSVTQQWEWDILSKIFHIGTQDVYSDANSNEISNIVEQHFNESASLNQNSPPFFLDKPGKLIDLPPPDINAIRQLSFLSVLQNRKTCRSFNGDSISLQQLSLALYLGFGLIHGNKWDEFDNSNVRTIGCRKASPASGALHAEEVYLFVYRVDELEQGVYHYRPQDHKLTQLAIGDYEARIIAANYNQFYSSGLACGLYLTCRLDKLWWKYKHSRSLKVALLDLGHASQTFLLSATALGLSTWITAAFQDKIVNELIHVDGTIESAFLFLGIGLGTNQAVPEAILQSLQPMD